MVDPVDNEKTIKIRTQMEQIFKEEKGKHFLKSSKRTYSRQR